jgi:hypothetical protein
MSRASEKKRGPAQRFSPAAMKDTIEKLVGKNEELSKQVELYGNEIAKLKRDNTHLSNQVASQNKELRLQKAARDRSESKFKREIDDLRKQIHRPKEEHDKLMMGQAASLFEQAICSYVLPDVYAKNKFLSICQLLNYLNDDRTKFPEYLDLSEADAEFVLEEGRRKWIYLCRNVFKFPGDWETKTGQGWDIIVDDRNTPDVIRAIYWLKKARVPIAHPLPVYLQKAEEKIALMKDSYPHYLFGIIKKFISSSMRDMIERSERRLKHADIIM